MLEGLGCEVLAVPAGLPGRTLVRVASRSIMTMSTAMLAQANMLRDDGAVPMCAAASQWATLRAALRLSRSGSVGLAMTFNRVSQLTVRAQTWQRRSPFVWFLSVDVMCVDDLDPDTQRHHAMVVVGAGLAAA